MAKNKLTKDQKRKKKLAQVKKKEKILVVPFGNLPDLEMYAEERLLRIVARLLADGTLGRDPETMRSLERILVTHDLETLLRTTGARLDISERAQTYAFAAMEASEEEDASRAMQWCEQSLSMDPGNIDALRTRLFFNKNVGSDELESLVSQARTRKLAAPAGPFPGDLESVFWSPYMRTVREYGRHLLQEERFEESAAVLQEALEIDPDDFHGLRIFAVLALLRAGDFASFDEELIALQTTAHAQEDATLVCETVLLVIFGMLERGEEKEAGRRFFDLLDEYPGVGKNILVLFSESLEGMDLPESLQTEISPADTVIMQGLLADVAFLGEYCQGWFITKVTLWFLERNGGKTDAGFFKGVALVRSEVLEVVAGFTDTFCDLFLDTASAAVCRNIIAALGESPVDFVQSLPESWAAGVIHFMGKQNGMFKTRHPRHFKAGSLAPHFGISAATYLNKSKLIHAELSRLGKNDVSLWGLEDGEEMKTLPKTSSKTASSFLAEGRVLELKIALQHVRPPVWRRVKVPGNLTLGEFHEVIQETMGWCNCHLHEFNVHGTTYSDPRAQLEEVLDENRVFLGDMLRVPGDRMAYTYDFGDSWDHLITLEKECPSAPSGPVLLCIKGKRACPPEDCGGPWGYERLPEILKDPDHEEHEDMCEWLGSDFDPEAFDMKAINGSLAALLKGFKKRK